VKPARTDLVIVGAGGAGLMAGIWAGRTTGGRQDVVLLEGAREPGRKILISGGGRCNVLPAVSEPDDFFTQGSRHVLRRLLATWPLAEQRDFFERDLGLPLVLEEETGKLFPAAQRARAVRDRLASAARDGGAGILCPWRVGAIERADDGFLLTADDGRTLLARRLVLATGGSSVPKTGSDGAGYEFARALGHTLLRTYPALVPLTTEDVRFTTLAGIALLVRWRALAGGRVVEERVRELLFTHHGFSGPAVLDASHWHTREGAEIRVAWAGLGREEWANALGASGGGRRAVATVLMDALPARLAELLCSLAGVAPALQLAQLDRTRRERLLDTLSDFSLPLSGSRGFAVAEVTGGGVPLGEVDPLTLESRVCPGLFLCGEILDAIGRIGGFNFQWAWATGRLAGTAAANAVTAPDSPAGTAD
jgi:predicted Rossmann fold flavoprotein